MSVDVEELIRLVDDLAFPDGCGDEYMDGIHAQVRMLAAERDAYREQFQKAADQSLAETYRADKAEAEVERLRKVNLLLDNTIEGGLRWLRSGREDAPCDSRITGAIVYMHPMLLKARAKEETK